jgi:hypothetical protein
VGKGNNQVAASKPNGRAGSPSEVVSPVTGYFPNWHNSKEIYGVCSTAAHGLEAYVAFIRTGVY